MVICIDDEKDLLETLELIFYSQGIEVFLFSDHASALRAIQTIQNKNNIDMVFCDKRMPCGEGIVFLRSLPDSIPKCLMSGDVTSESIEFPVIAKPFEKDELIELVKAAQKNKKQ